MHHDTRKDTRDVGAADQHLVVIGPEMPGHYALKLGFVELGVGESQREGLESVPFRAQRQR